jgi:hypothetical protein
MMKQRPDWPVSGIQHNTTKAAVKRSVPVRCVAGSRRGEFLSVNYPWSVGFIWQLDKQANRPIDEANG